MTGWPLAAARAAYYTFREFAVEGSAGDRIDVQLTSEFLDVELQTQELRLFSLQAQELMTPDDSLYIGHHGLAPPLMLTGSATPVAGPTLASQEGAGGQ